MISSRTGWYFRNSLTICLWRVSSLCRTRFGCSSRRPHWAIFVFDSKEVSFGATKRVPASNTPPESVINHQSLDDVYRSICSRDMAFAIASTCWQSYHDTSALRYEKKPLRFASSDVGVQSSLSKLLTGHVTNLSLRRLSQLQLKVVRAKYNIVPSSISNISIRKHLAQQCAPFGTCLPQQIES